MHLHALEINGIVSRTDVAVVPFDTDDKDDEHRSGIEYVDRPFVH